MEQNRKDRRKYVALIFLPTILAGIIQELVAIFAMQIYVVKDLVSYTSGSYSDFIIDVITDFSSDFAIELLSVSYAIITAILGYIAYRKYFKNESNTPLRDCSKNIPMTIAGIFLFVIATQYVTTYLVSAISSAFPSWLEEYTDILESAGLDSDITVMMALYVCLLGPICEEILFRGLTYHAAKKVMPVSMAVLVQAILFGVFHLNKIQGIYAFLLGLGLGYVMYLYDNIIVTIIIHIGYNILGSVDTSYLPGGGDTLISFFAWTLGSLIAVYFALILLKKGASRVNDDSFFADI